jgi:hypothetical protein
MERYPDQRCGSLTAKLVAGPCNSYGSTGPPSGFWRSTRNELCLWAMVQPDGASDVLGYEHYVAASNSLVLTVPGVAISRKPRAEVKLKQ